MQDNVNNNCMNFKNNIIDEIDGGIMELYWCNNIVLLQQLIIVFQYLWDAIVSLLKSLTVALVETVCNILFTLWHIMCKYKECKKEW